MNLEIDTSCAEFVPACAMAVLFHLCRCSETGAAFFSDMFSKHAMHSGGAEEVLFAGEQQAVVLKCEI